MTEPKQYGDARWWDQDKLAAIAYAKAHGETAVWSAGPRTGVNMSEGYWTDPSSFVRSWETLVWSPA